MANVGTKLSMKLLIDTKAKKVVFGEAEKDCVDFLFHILSLPVGFVTKLLKEKRMSGCLSNLYQSVENLNDTYLITKSKDLILKPECPLAIDSIPLHLFSYPPRLTEHPVVVPIRRSDDRSANYPVFGKRRVETMTPVAATGGFVKELQVKYMVMDDLVVKPMSAVSSITSLKKFFKVKDVGALQEQVVHFGKEEAMKLLKLSLESNTVLTSLFVSQVKVEK